MKILVISGIPWNTNNSFGNSYANIFDGMDDCEFANVYCAEGMVNDVAVSRAYKMTPKMLLMNLLDRKKPSGIETPVVDDPGTGEHYSDTDKKLLHFAKTHRWMMLFWAREALWRFGRWNSSELKAFIRDFAPDILFCPINANSYINRIVLEVQGQLQVPMVGYISDDNYTLRQFSFSPLYWIDRLLFRRWVKKVIDHSNILYVISDIQKREYDKIFHKDCHILTKGMDFTQEKPAAQGDSKPYHLVFAGNIGSNRWKSLALIGKAIQNINKNAPQMDLTIYTATPLTAKMSRALNIPGSIRVAGRIPYQEVARKQEAANILVHVEATDIFYRWGSHQGFSTKLVDYMASNRPILAYGLEDQASIAHLKKHDAALVATNPQELEDVLNSIIENPQKLYQYADNAWQCGAKYHDIRKFHAMLKQDFDEVIKR